MSRIPNWRPHGRSLGSSTISTPRDLNFRKSFGSAPVVDLSGPAFHRANGDQVTIPNRSNIGLPKCHNRLGATRSSYKLNLESIRVIDLYDRAKVSAAQPLLWDVPLQNNGIQRFESHRDHPG